MTRDQMLSDLYERLTSRKLALALLSIGFAWWSYHLGDLTAQQFQQAVMVAVTAFTAAEAAADAVAAYKPKPSIGDAQTVVVGTEAQPAATAAMSPPAVTSKRVRPSRARAKPAGVKV